MFQLVPSCNSLWWSHSVGAHRYIAKSVNENVTILCFLVYPGPCWHHFRVKCCCWALKKCSVSRTNLPPHPPQLSVFSLDDLQISAEITWQKFYDLYNGTLERNITAQSEYYNTVLHKKALQKKRFGKENQKLIAHIPYPYSQFSNQKSCLLSWYLAISSDWPDMATISRSLGQSWAR